MTTKKLTEHDIEYRRRRALILVREIINDLEKDKFTHCDFALDMFVRTYANLPTKSLGKPPYDFVNN